MEPLWNCRISSPLVRAVLPSIVLAASIPLYGAQEPDSCGIIPGDLRLEYLVNPLGIDELQPRLSWKLAPTDPAHRGLRQSEYQILVASSHDSLDRDQGSLWDSGHVASDQSILIPYQGKPLHSGMGCWWKVRVWDEWGQMSAWSVPAFWSMGPLRPVDWDGAQWIGLNEGEEAGVDISDIKTANWVWYPEGNPAQDAGTAPHYFRRTFALPVDRTVRRALCLFAADSFCQFYVNGAHVGMGQGFKALGGADIAGQLKPGINQLAIRATNAAEKVPQNPGAWIGAVRIEFDQGPPLVLQTDGSWVCAKTAPANWQSAELDDSDWVAAMEVGRAGIAPWGMPWKNEWHTEHRQLPARYLRCEFKLPREKIVRRATAYVCGLGFFDIHMNGRLISDQLMNPALTGYNKRVLYVTFDVTPELHAGANAIGVELSNGRFFAPRVSNPMPMHTYGYPQLIAKLDVEFEDGSHDVIVSGGSWKLSADGPTRASNEYDGEEYDARKEIPGWSSPGFDDSSWRSAALVESPGGHLEAQMMEPLRVTEALKPVQVLQPKPGIWMVDFGQAFYGVVRLTASGPAGTRVSMRTSFNTLPDGTLNYLNDRSARNTDIYTLKGEGVETWHPRFRGNATRWVQVEGFPGTPTTESFAGFVTHTDFDVAGEFACANDLVNRVYLNARWGTRMQNRTVPMEPDRDERMPWSGHPAKTSESEGWEFNVARFYDHFLHNYRVHQAEDGSLQEILPPYWTFNSKDIIWPSVATIIPDWYYNFYGDDKPLRENYDMMKAFTLYHERTNLKADGTMDHCNYGDWVDTASMDRHGGEFGATSRPLMGTAYFYNNCRIVERAARLFGKAEDEQYFRELADRVHAGFNQRFFVAATGTYESDTQCACALPLAFGLVPDEHWPAVVKRLVDDIMVRHNGHTSVGLIGMQWQMQVLTAIGHPEAAWSIITRTDRPSWGYMISKGATTSWERWDTDTQDGGMNGESQKILSGNVEAWCYQTLGGINYDPEQPGFKHIMLRPRLLGDLAWVRAAHVSPYGRIESDWKRKNGAFEWRVVVPPNTTATVYVPSAGENGVKESGVDIKAAPGVTLLRREPGATVVEVGSGSYTFSAPTS
jgi:alpha-L-rhamnosidase